MVSLLAFRNVVSQRQSLKEFGMHCYAFRNVVSQRRSLQDSSKIKKEFRMYCFISLLNVCFKIFCRKYQTPRGRRRGGMRGRGRRREEEEEGGIFKVVFFFV